MHTEQYVPLNRGFDLHYGILTGGGSHTMHISVSGKVIARGQSDSHTFSGANLWDNGKFSVDNQAKVHTTELYTKRAVDMVEHLETSGSNPWFVFLSFQAIHDPIEVGNEAFITATKCNAIDEATQANRRIMCGMMAEVDDGLRQVREKLVSLGAWEKTLVVYASDNGGLTTHGSSNAPFAGEKGMYSEGGVHVPAFFAGGFLTKILASASVDAFSLKARVHITDLHTTILGLAGYAAAKEAAAADTKLDGLDLWAQLVPVSAAAAKSSARTELLINANSEVFGSSGALIVGDYKLMVNADPQESTIYMRVKAYIQASATEPSPDAVAKAAVNEAKKAVDGKLFLFNLAKNPYELDLGEGCETGAAYGGDVEACANLAGLAAFASVEADLKARLDSYRTAAVPSSFAWEDDGALASPQLFGNLWSPWRDVEGAPKLVFTGLHKGEGSSAFVTGATTTTATSLAASLAAAATASPAEVLAALAGAAGAVALMVGAAFRAGANSAKRGGEQAYSPVPQY